MASNKRDLKAYARFDGSGRIVPGSTILRKKMPKVGKWKEVQTYECCNYDPCIYFTIEATEGNLNFFFSLNTTTAGSDVTGTITWGDGVIQSFTIDDGSSLGFNHTFPSVGFFNGTLCVDHPSRITFFGTSD